MPIELLNHVVRLPMGNEKGQNPYQLTGAAARPKLETNFESSEQALVQPQSNCHRRFSTKHRFQVDIYYRVWHAEWAPGVVQPHIVLAFLVMASKTKHEVGLGATLCEADSRRPSLVLL